MSLATHADSGIITCKVCAFSHTHCNDDDDDDDDDDVIDCFVHDTGAYDGTDSDTSSTLPTHPNTEPTDPDAMFVGVSKSTSTALPSASRRHDVIDGTGGAGSEEEEEEDEDED